MAEQTETPEEPGEDAPVEIADKPREPTEYEKRLRREAANARAGKKAAEQERDTAKAAAQEEIERVKSEAHTAANDRIIRAEMKAAAAKAGMVDLDGLKLLDLSAVKLNEAGDIEIPAGFFDAAKAAKPYLFGAPGSSSSHAGDPPPPPNGGTKKATDMTPEEYKAARAALIDKN